MQSGNIEVIFQDDWLIAVNKPSGFLVHRGPANDKVTVADLVRDQLAGGPVHAVHRLDRGASGVLLFALSASAAAYFQEQMLQGGQSVRSLAEDCRLHVFALAYDLGYS